MTNNSGEAGSIAGVREAGDAGQSKDTVRSVSMTARLRQGIHKETKSNELCLLRRSSRYSSLRATGAIADVFANRTAQRVAVKYLPSLCVATL
jgi:hypothetical protein